MKMKQVSRYHPLLVTLHWLLAVLIIAALAIGFFWLSAMPNSDPRKINVLLVHMAGGMLILALMVIRFIVRWWTAKPPAATTGNPRLDRITLVIHYGFYILVVLMAGTGFATAILARLNEIVFAGSGEPLLPTLMIFPTRVAHGYIALLLACFIILHVAAAIYHQFVRKDGVIRRMFFGRRELN
jgi:cytochrome b561